LKSLSDLLGPDDFVQQGASPAKGVVVLACTVGDNYNDPKNRILILQDGAWLEFTFGGEALLGVDASAGGDAFVLGEEGSVIEFEWQQKDLAKLKATRKLYENPAVNKLGPLRQLRILGNDVLTAGSMGQVYRLVKGKFKALPQLEVAGEEDVIIEDIGGESASDFIAVTLEGYAASFDGKKWRRIDLPTNAALNNITPMDDGRFAIVGKSGTLLIGSAKQWHVVPPIDEDRDYYGVAFRDGKVYAAHIEGIDVFDGKRLKPVSLGKSKSLDFAKLRNGPEGVWAFQDHTVGVITTKGWQQLK
jgi:hypothetical protein